MDRTLRLIVERFLFLFLGLLAMVAVVANAQGQEAATQYSDVEAGAWYEDSATYLLDIGALDSAEPRLRPNAQATRAEVMKMLVLVSGKQPMSPSVPSFNDVSRSAWYYTFVETAADAGWVRGDRDCYEVSRPCMARPGDGVNRAEMAALLQRTFSLSYDQLAPVFADVRQGNWYYVPVQTAADHCILQGDDATGNARPAALMNRAEMVVMFARAAQEQRYGRDCGVPETAGQVTGVSALSAQRVRVSFNTALDEGFADDTSRYVLQRIGGSQVAIDRVLVLDSRTVELELGVSMTPNATYRISVSNMRTEAGRLFQDEETFIYSPTSGEILDVSVRNATTVRVRFDADLDTGRADDAGRYSITAAGSGTALAVIRADVIDARTVDLTVSQSFRAGVSYMLDLTGIRTSQGVEFSDRASFVMLESTPRLIDALALSASRVQINFNTALDDRTVTERSHYRIMSENHQLAIGRATLLSSNSVELTLDEPMQAQRFYSVRVTELKTSGGVVFSGTGSFVYAASDVRLRATLTGIQETPPVVTGASGSGTFTLTASGLQYDITVRDMSGALITGAHFHRGSPGAPGPVVRAVTFTGTRATATWSGLTEQDRNDILNGLIYINVHTQARPDGEIRGQLIVQ